MDRQASITLGTSIINQYDFHQQLPWTPIDDGMESSFEGRQVFIMKRYDHGDGWKPGGVLHVFTSTKSALKLVLETLDGSESPTPDAEYH